VKTVSACFSSTGLVAAAQTTRPRSYGSRCAPSIVIRDVKNIGEFVAAVSLKDAVDAFVRFFEAPADIPGQSAQRLEIAQRLMA